MRVSKGCSFPGLPVGRASCSRRAMARRAACRRNRMRRHRVRDDLGATFGVQVDLAHRERTAQLDELADADDARRRGRLAQEVDVKAVVTASGTMPISPRMATYQRHVGRGHQHGPQTCRPGAARRRRRRAQIVAPAWPTSRTEHFISGNSCAMNAAISSRLATFARSLPQVVTRGAGRESLSPRSTTARRCDRRRPCRSGDRRRARHRATERRAASRSSSTSSCRTRRASASSRYCSSVSISMPIAAAISTALPFGLFSLRASSASRS